MDSSGQVLSEKIPHLSQKFVPEFHCRKIDALFLLDTPLDEEIKRNWTFFKNIVTNFLECSICKNGPSCSYFLKNMNCPAGRDKYFSLLTSTSGRNNTRKWHYLEKVFELYICEAIIAFIVFFSCGKPILLINIWKIMLGRVLNIFCAAWE